MIITHAEHVLPLEVDLYAPRWSPEPTGYPQVSTTVTSNHNSVVMDFPENPTWNRRTREYATLDMYLRLILQLTYTARLSQRVGQPKQVAVRMRVATNHKLWLLEVRGKPVPNQADLTIPREALKAWQGVTATQVGAYFDIPTAKRLLDPTAPGTANRYAGAVMLDLQQLTDIARSQDGPMDLSVAMGRLQR